MDTENLNIEYHKKRLLIKALNKYRYQHLAAGPLGISVRTLMRYINAFDLIKDENGFYRERKQIKKEAA